MRLIHLYITLFLMCCVGCHSDNTDSINSAETNRVANGVLLTTRIHSFDALKEIISIDYSKKRKRYQVRLRHSTDDQEVVSILNSGISENDFYRAKLESVWDKIWLAIQSPYAVANREDLLKAYMLARRKYEVYGEGDVAFFDFAEQMVRNISKRDLDTTSAKDLSEKGYLNTFNHFMAQSFYTSIFSEKMADFIADVHERNRLPELITGEFSEAQINDINEGAVDNYVDMINNEWGQEFGKLMKAKYKIKKDTYWTSEMLVDYLNDIQDYMSWAFGIGFRPFRVEDDVVVRYAYRINRIMDDPSIFLN